VPVGHILDHVQTLQWKISVLVCLLVVTWYGQGALDIGEQWLICCRSLSNLKVTFLSHARVIDLLCEPAQAPFADVEAAHESSSSKDTPAGAAFARHEPAFGAYRQCCSDNTFVRRD